MRGRQEIWRFWFDIKKTEYARGALFLYNEALKLDPDYPSALAAKGEVYTWYEINYDSTLYYCNRALRLDPGLAMGYLIRGRCYDEMKEYDLALKDYLKTIELSPNYPSKIYSWIVKIYFEQKEDYVQALKYIKKFIEENPREGHDFAGHLFLVIGEYEKAEYHFFKIIQSEDPYWGIHYYCITLDAQGKHQEALDFLDSISESLCNRSDEFKRLCYWKKWTYSILLKKFEQANDYYNLLVDSAGGIPGFFSFDSIKLAYMYRNLGRDNLADITLDKIRRSLEYKLKTNSSGHYPLIVMPSIYSLLGDKEKAVSYLSELIEQNYIVGGIQDEVKNSPLYENLWGDPEFEALVKRMQDDKAAIRAQIREKEEQGELDLSL